MTEHDPTAVTAAAQEWIPGEVSVASVANLLAEAKYLDPGLRRASLPPMDSPSRERFERVRDHYIAYGIRHALMILGFEDQVEQANAES